MVVGRPFGSEFSASVIIAELWLLEVTRPGNFVSNFCFFFAKTTPYGKIVKILFRKFTWRLRSTLLCSNVVKNFWQEIGEIVPFVRYSHNKKTNKISAPFQNFAIVRGSHPKCARASSQHLVHTHTIPDFIQSGSLSQSYSRMHQHHSFAP